MASLAVNTIATKEWEFEYEDFTVDPTTRINSTKNWNSSKAAVLTRAGCMQGYYKLSDKCIQIG